MRVYYICEQACRIKGKGERRMILFRLHGSRPIECPWNRTRLTPNASRFPAGPSSAIRGRWVVPYAGRLS